MFIDLKLLSLQ